MPEVGQALNSASLFAGVLGLLFSSWIEDIKSASEQPLPQHYLDRKSYFSTVSTVIWAKALPLTFILLAFAYSYLPVALQIVAASDIVGIDEIRDGSVQIEWTTFSLVYCIIAYFAAISVWSTLNLVGALRSARKGRPANVPRIHLLG